MVAGGLCTYKGSAWSFISEHHILASGCENKDHRLEDMDSSRSDHDRRRPPRVWEIV